MNYLFECVHSVPLLRKCHGLVGVDEPLASVMAFEPPKLSIERSATRLAFRLHQQTGDSDAKAEGGDGLIVMREVSVWVWRPAPPQGWR